MNIVNTKKPLELNQVNVMKPQYALLRNLEWVTCIPQKSTNFQENFPTTLLYKVNIEWGFNI